MMRLRVRRALVVPAPGVDADRAHAATRELIKCPLSIAPSPTTTRRIVPSLTRDDLVKAKNRHALCLIHMAPAI